MHVPGDVVVERGWAAGAVRALRGRSDDCRGPAVAIVIRPRVRVDFRRGHGRVWRPQCKNELGLSHISGLTVIFPLQAPG